MHTFLIFIASFGTTYLIARRTDRGFYTLADLAIGIFAGLAGLGMADLLRAEGTDWQLGLPIFIACALVFGLESLPRRPSWR